ncbi:hypothetical protein ISCGN_031494 [Ixodes scapularis]
MAVRNISNVACHAHPCFHEQVPIAPACRGTPVHVVCSWLDPDIKYAAPKGLACHCDSLLYTWSEIHHYKMVLIDGGQLIPFTNNSKSVTTTRTTLTCDPMVPWDFYSQQASLGM